MKYKYWSRTMRGLKYQYGKEWWDKLDEYCETIKKNKSKYTKDRSAYWKEYYLKRKKDPSYVKTRKKRAYKYFLDNKEAVQVKQREYYLGKRKDPEFVKKSRERSKEWKKNNKEKAKASWKKYYYKNKQKKCQT